MRYISVFSGIESASAAWAPLGWDPVAFSEIEPFPCAVLEHRFPGVPNLGDITEVDWSPYSGSVDVVVYKALGNSMAVNVMAWIGRRIELVDDIVDGADAGV